jgi:hypothetical protein
MTFKCLRSLVVLLSTLVVACGGDKSTPSSAGAPTDTASTGTQPRVAASQSLSKSGQQLASALGINTRAGELKREDVAKWMNEAFAAAETADGELARDTFEVSAVATAVGPDREKLLAWIRDNTQLVPYRGVLRGPAGVLMDRLGNSLDRALLLSELLRGGGDNVRLAHGKLSKEQATALMRDWGSRPNIAPSISAPDAPAPDGVAAYAASHGLDAARLREAVQQIANESQAMTRNLQQRIDRQSKDMAKILPRSQSYTNGVAPADLESARDHWWVQYQDGGKWRDLDPDAADAGSALVAATETVDTAALPEDLYHRVTIRVVVERISAGEREESKVLEHSLRPLDVLGKRVVLRHQPINWAGRLETGTGPLKASFEAAVTAQDEWMPVLSVGNETVAQKSFSKSGQVNDTPGSGAKPEPTGNAFGALSGGLGGGEEPAAAGMLTAEWIEYEIQIPGAAPRVIRRDVFDLLGPYARSQASAAVPPITQIEELQRGLALIGETDMLLLGGQVSREFVEHVANANLLAQRESMNAILQPGVDLNRLAELSGSLNPVSGELYGLALARATQSPVVDRMYLDRPNILTYHRRVRADAGGGYVRSNSLDIVANDVAVRPGADPFNVRLVQGVVDTAAENLFVGGCTSCGPVQNVFEMWGSSAWVAVRTPEELAARGSALNDDARRRVAEDLSRGYAVLLPTQAAVVEGQSRMGWWRVDRATGTTLGIMESGEGQAMVEYVKQKASLAGTIIFLGTFLDCVSPDGANLTKAAACLGCGAVAGHGIWSTFLSAGRVTLTNVTPGFAGRLFAVAAVCIVAGLM